MKKDFNALRGDSKTLSFSYAGDITAQSLSFVVKADKGLTSSRLIQKLNSVAGGSVSEIKTTYDDDAQSTEIEVYLEAEDTQDLTNKILVYDLLLGSANTIYMGNLYLEGDVQTPYDGTNLPTSNAVRYMPIYAADVADGQYIMKSGAEFVGADLSTVISNSHSHANKPTLDAIEAALTTALKSNYDSAYNWVHSYGFTDYVRTNDSRLNDSRPASDVYSWAKASTKPSYTASDVGLGNVTNESKATMFTSPSFTGNATFSGVALHPNGSASAPSMSFSGDTNSGLYSVGADAVGIATNGVNRVTVDNTNTTVANTLYSSGANYFANAVHAGGDFGGYQFDGVDDYVTVADNDNLDFGTNNFSIEVYFKTGASVSGTQRIFYKGASATGVGYNLHIYNGTLYLSIQDATGTTNYSASTLTLTANTVYNLFITCVRTGNAITYVNGVSNKTQSITTSAGTISNSLALIIGGQAGSNSFQGFIYLSRFYNRALSASEVLTMYNNGRPDLFNLQYADRSANNTNTVINGTFDADANWIKSSGVSISGGKAILNAVAHGGVLYQNSLARYGKKYRITFTISDYVQGGVRVELGGIAPFSSTYSANGTYSVELTNQSPSNEALYFTSINSGSTSTLNIDDVSIIPIGCVAEYLPENAGNIGWVESSGNQLSGQTSGSPISLNVARRPMQYRDIKKGITNAATTLTAAIPKGYVIKEIRLKGSGTLADVKIGSTSGGEEIVAGTSASTTEKLATLASTANAGYSETTDRTIYVQHSTAGQTLDIIIKCEKVGN